MKNKPPRLQLKPFIISLMLSFIINFTIFKLMIMLMQNIDNMKIMISVSLFQTAATLILAASISYVFQFKKFTKHSFVFGIIMIGLTIINFQILS